MDRLVVLQIMLYLVLIKKELPNSKLCYGGPHEASILLDLIDNNVDMVIKGDGEIPLIKFSNYC